MSENGKSFNDLLSSLNNWDGDDKIKSESETVTNESKVAKKSVENVVLPSLDNEIVNKEEKSEVERPSFSDLMNGLSKPSNQSEQEKTERDSIGNDNNRVESREFPNGDGKKEESNVVGLPVLPDLDDSSKQVSLPDLGSVSINDEIKEEELIEKDPSEISVTPDGRSLEEMLTGMYSGPTGAEKRLKEVKEGLREVEVNGKVKSDSTYTKHSDRLKREKERAEGKKKASKGFVARNARYTEEEKLIIKSLGLSPKEFDKVMSLESDLTAAEKSKLISMGVANGERIFKGKRFKATVGDLDIIIFLAKFKYANTRILSRLRMENQSVTWRKLNRLKERGLVADTEILGMGTLWFLTTAGMGLSGYNFTPYKRNPPKMSSMPPVIGANHVAACLWNNTHDILFDDEFPRVNREVSKGGVVSKVQGENLTSELEIRSSMGRESNPAFNSVAGSGGNAFAEVGELAKVRWNEWIQGGRNPLDSPEMGEGNEYMWVLFPEGVMTKSYHVPDLVVVRDRDSDGKPNSIAVEVELNAKTRERYLDTLMAYKLDENIYGKVVWVTNNNSVSRMLIEIAQEIGLDKFDVVPMTNEHGEYKLRDIWHI